MGNYCCLGCCPSERRPASQSPQPSDPVSQSAPHSDFQPQSPSGHDPQPPVEKIVDYKQQFGSIDDAAQLEPLVNHIGELLREIKNKHEASTSSEPESSKTGEFVKDNVEGASKFLEHISTEAEKLHDSNLTSKLPGEIEKVACKALESLGNLHWIAVGFSVIAFALQRIGQVKSNSEKCIELLETMFDLAKRLQQQHERVPTEIENINKGVIVIVDAVITCCSCMTQQQFFKYLFASTDDEKLQKLESLIQKVKTDLSMTIATDVQGRAMDIQAQIPRQDFVSEYKWPAHAVGIDDRVAEVKKLLDMSGKEKPTAVILHGFGGIGKTTLAECVMSQLDLTGFKHCRIQLDEKQSDMKSHQEVIWAHLKKERRIFQDSVEGRQELQKIMQKEAIFIFIDNALKKEQINDLLPLDLSLRAESRMLITTRHTSIIDELLDRNSNCSVYRVDKLPPDTAKDLFRKKVRRNEKIPPDQIDAVAEKLHGVPLLLKVYAQYLVRYGDTKVCKEMLERLGEGDFSYTHDHGNVEKTLRYVFDRLDKDDQEAFIDVCIYFHGWFKENVSYILKQREFNALLDGALVNIDSSDNVVVHDVLRAMGIKSGERNRVQENDNWETALADKKEELKGTWFLDYGRSDKELDVQCQRLRAVRVLALGNRIRLTGERRVSLTSLRYLRIEDPAWEHPIFEQLHALQCAILIYDGEYSPSSESLSQNFKSMRNLQYLQLRVRLMEKFPDDFRFADSLRELDLSGCRNLTSLPDGFGTLSALQTLNLWSCKNLTSLPDGFGTLSALQSLSLSYCKNLTSLPDGFGTLSALQTLSLSYCINLVSLPDGFGSLKSLQKLTLKGCSRLKSLSHDFDGLPMLADLDLSDCGELEGGSMEKLTKLKNLRSLRINGSTKLILTWKDMGTPNLGFQVIEKLPLFFRTPRLFS